MNDYHASYLKCDFLSLADLLKCDFLSLADLFEKLINNSLKNYGLCLSHYLRATGSSWKAMFKITKIKLELIPDPDMHIFFEKDKRDKISDISNRYSKASNKYLKFYDSKQESKHIICLDTNNLYGCAKSKFFPASGIKWMDSKDLTKYISNCSKGCVLEVVLEYFKELQKLHNHYPLTPDKIEVKREMLCEYQLNC